MSFRLQPAESAREMPALFGDMKDDFLSDLDRAFTEIQLTPDEEEVQPKKPLLSEVPENGGLSEMHSTFVAVSRVHLAPVHRYLKAIHLGVASKDLCEIVHYVAGPVIGKTRKVGLTEHTKALISFQRQLTKIVKGSRTKVSQDQSRLLSQSFDRVRETFSLTMRGHATAVVNLLGYYKRIRRSRKFSQTDIKKLFAIGIPSLTMLRKSSIAELASVSGIAADRVAHFRNMARDFVPISYN